jgi:Fuc2NAc and GlcNAc transferase
VAALAFALVVATTPVFQALALRWGLLDLPNPRSSHGRPVARGGGAVLVLSAALCLLLTRAQWPFDAAHGMLLFGAVLVAGVGFLDDRFGLSVWPRLALHLAAAAVFVAAAGGLHRLPLPPPLDLALWPLGAAVSIVWIVAVVNFYNFLDGIDGLAGVQGVVTGLGVALAGWDTLASLAGASLAGGCLGFLLFNWSPARIFLGDIGSGFLGYTFAALPLLAPKESRPEAVLFVALSLWLFLSDATWTLCRRVRRGEQWYRAHREHLYQRLALAGWTHADVATAIGLGSAALTTLALLAWRRELSPWASAAGALVLFGAELRATRLVERRAAHMGASPGGPA